MTALFYISLIVVCYAFAGYGLILYVLVKVRRLIKGNRTVPGADGDLPSVTVVVAAYNEAPVIEEKIANSLSLRYPAGKARYLFVTDGSNDGTPEIVARHKDIMLLHDAARNGKIAAIHRAMQHVETDVVVFTDANTLLNEDALINICRHYADATVGAVSGEKRVAIDQKGDATAGEGMYWKYESQLKKWDSELYSVVGAAGELFSIRTALYEPVPGDTILDDFMISMLIAGKGYRIVYEPQAFATETASESVGEELKRKVRIAAGGMQSIIRLRPLLLPFRYPVLSFQYMSHRVLRWTVTPFLMVSLLVSNLYLVARGGGRFYSGLLAAQSLFYLLALAGWVQEGRKVKIKAFFIPYYFCMMNYAVAAGIVRYFSGRQSAVWEKAKRR